MKRIEKTLLRTPALVRQNVCGRPAIF